LLETSETVLFRVLKYFLVTLFTPLPLEKTETVFFRVTKYFLVTLFTPLLSETTETLLFSSYKIIFSHLIYSLAIRNHRNCTFFELQNTF